MYMGKPNELYHHGIMGQRWGKRNGPPYPLAPGDHSATESRLKSKNEGKLESWRKKQTAKIDKKYGKRIVKTQKRIDAVNRGLDKQRSEGSSGAKTRLKEMALTTLTNEKSILEAAKRRETLEINSYTLSDVRKEKLYVGKKMVQNTLITVGTALLPVKVIAFATPEQLKTQYRTVEHPKKVERRKQKAEAKEERASINGLPNFSKSRNDSERAKQDAEKDFYFIRANLPGSRMNVPSERDYAGYAKRHSDQDSSLASKLLNKKGGASVSEEYANAYEQARQKLLSDYKHDGSSDKILAKIDKATKPKFKVESNKNDAYENSPASKIIRPEYQKNGRISDKTLIKAINADKSFRERAEINARSVRKYEPATVQKAKSMRNSGMTYAEIGERLGLDDEVIWSLVNRK